MNTAKQPLFEQAGLGQYLRRRAPRQRCRVPAVEFLYALKIARRRDKEEQWCLLAAISDCETVPNLPVDPQFAFAFRSHLEPETNVGPAYTKIVYERVIKFSH